MCALLVYCSKMVAMCCSSSFVQCELNPRIPYTQFSSIIKKQKQVRQSITETLATGAVLLYAYRWPIKFSVWPAKSEVLFSALYRARKKGAWGWYL